MTWCPGIREVAQSEGEGTVVCPELERGAFHLKPKVTDGAEGSQKLSVEGAVVGLTAVQLLGEESQWLPRATWAALLVKGGPHVGSAGVRHQSQLGVGRGV